MKRITIDPKVMGGVPCLRGLRIPVATMVNMVAGGFTTKETVELGLEQVEGIELRLAAREDRIVVSVSGAVVVVSDERIRIRRLSVFHEP